MTRNINEKYLLEFISSFEPKNELLELVNKFKIKLPVCENNSVYQIIEELNCVNYNICSH